MKKNSENIEIVKDINITTYIRTILVNGKKAKEKVTVRRKRADFKKGLNQEEVNDRLLANWGNNNKGTKTKTIKAIIFTNLFTVFNLLNLAIAGWLASIFMFNQMFFIVIVAANTIIGTIQEIKAKKMIDNLSLLSAPCVNVIREEEEQETAVSNLVLDDIVVLKAGKQVCSDSVIREGNVEVNESLLTGESDPIIKKIGDTLLSGSFIVSGSCLASVEKVGNDNYIETLANNAKKYVRPNSDLLRSLNWIIRTVGALIIILAPTYFFMKFSSVRFDSNEYQDIVLGTTAAIIGMIPSGLFLLTSVALAVGVVRLAKNKTLVQELYCIEMLARVNILCLDKTGTITDGTMKVRKLIEYEKETKLSVKQIISAILNAQNDDNLTSKALENKFGLGKKLKANNIIPFSSSRKYSAVEFAKQGAFILGAPEFVLKKNYDKIAYDVERSATLGYRILLLASADRIDDKNIYGEVKPIALILIEDTIRDEAVDTIKYFRENGVSVRVISGDNPLTVSKVSQRAGILDADKYISLDGMSDTEVIKNANRYTVFGRVKPDQKQLLIKTLKSQGNTVAMTGDGVNDILALKEADCSIAMASGSEAARNVSHLVLLDSNFGSLPKVVNEGRRVINNIQRVSTLFLVKTIFSSLLLLIITISLFTGWDLKYPIQPLQLNIIDILVIGIPAFILAVETNNSQIKGKFLVNVLKNAIPGAMAVVFNILIVFGLAKTLGLGSVAAGLNAEGTTIIVISMTFTCMLVLFKICRPFNYLRIGLFAAMFASFIIIILSSYETFGLVSLFEMTTPGKLLLLVLLYQAYPMIVVFSEGWGFIKEKFKIITESLGNIEI